MKLVVSLLLLNLVAPAWADSTTVLQFSDEQIRGFGIETAAVEPVQQSASKIFPAKVVVPNAQLRVLGSPLEGVVEALLVAEGENVTQDQALARIRSARLLDLQAAFLEARTRRQLSSETLQRDRKLRADGIIAERRLLESQSSHRELVAAEARDRQTLRLAGMSGQAIDQLAKDQQLSAVLEVKAPLSGVVLEQLATAGQRLAAADPLYRVGDLSTLWIEVHVPLESLGDLATGARVELPAQQVSARVITVGRMVHGTDQGVLVRAAVSEGAERLRPGQFVEARIQHPASGGALRVPAVALVRNNEGDYVFARDPQGFAALPVEVLAREGDSAVIRAALPAQAAVVVRGTAALKAAWVGGSE